MTERRGHNSTIRRAWRRVWARPEGRWPWARWGLTLLIPVAGLLWLASALLAPEEPRLLRIHVESQVTGEAVEGATVVVGGDRYVTGESGDIRIDPVPAGTRVLVSADGHESMEREVTGGGEEIVVSLSAVLVLGSLTDVVSGEPIGDADLAIVDASGAEVATSRTDDSGSFVFKFIPENAELVIDHDVYGQHRQAIGERRSLMVQLAPPDVEGRVVDQEGNPVAGALVSGPQIDIVTGDDGRFRLERVGQGTELTVGGSDAGRASVVVRGTDLGDIELRADASSPEATPERGGA